MKTNKILISSLVVLSGIISFSFASDLSSCSTYFDGCNTCTVKDGKIESCTEKSCKATKTPYCIDDSASTDLQIATPEDKTSVERVPPYYNNNEKTYKFDEDAVKALNKQTSSLIKVNCDTTKIMKSLGFSSSMKMFSVGIESDDYDYTFDIRNCTMYGNKRNYTWTGKPITEAKALATAKSFIKSTFFTNKIFAQYGDPIVMARNGNNPGPILYKDSSSRTEFADIEIDPTDTGVLEAEYTSFSILLPYKVNGKDLYNSYGNMAGISLEVTAEGVSSVNAQLLPFKGAVRSSEKLTSDETISFVKRGGNGAFRGTQETIELNKPERVNVLFSIWKNNINEMYISSGIRFGSSIKVDQRQQQPYQMIISDYKIGNSNYGY